MPSSPAQFSKTFMNSPDNKLQKARYGSPDLTSGRLVMSAGKYHVVRNSHNFQNFKEAIHSLDSSLNDKTWKQKFLPNRHFSKLIDQRVSEEFNFRNRCGRTGRSWPKSAVLSRIRQSTFPSRMETR